MADTNYCFAEVDLNDAASYEDGYKAPRVLEWLPIQRGLSDHAGQIQHLSFGAILADTDYFFRTRLDSPTLKYLTNRPATVKMIEDEDRRAELEPQIIANGFVGDYSPLDNLRIEVKCYDWMKRRFTRRARSNESWQPRITLQDFPRANGVITTDEGELHYNNAGTIIPIIYGRITDTKLAGDWPWDDTDDPLTDEGDGQFVPIYVGDYELMGETWRGALIAAHHCEYIEAGFIFHDPVDLRNDTDWLTPRRVDGSWGAAGFSSQNPVITIKGHDYCMIFLKGYAGDLFCGKEPVPEIRQGKFGNVPIAINVWGRSRNGAGDGVLLTDGFEQYEDFLANYVTAEPVWTSGAPEDVPEFSTISGLQLVDTASFETCQQVAELRVGGGYELNFVIGANNEEVSILDVIAQFNICLDCQHYWNWSGQFAISMEPEDDSDAAEDGIDDVVDITAGTFKVVDQVTQNFFNILPFRHTFDYTGRMQAQFKTDWRSEMTGDLERRHESSITNYDQERRAAVYEFRFIRGRNRLSDSPYYDQGSATVEDIMMRLAARYADPMRIVSLVAPYNLLGYECGDVFPLTTIEGIGASGWTNRMVRILNMTVDANKGQVFIDAYDLRTVMDNREELTTTTGGSPLGSPEYSPTDVGSPGSP
jgi:hypothetical protein